MRYFMTVTVDRSVEEFTAAHRSQGSNHPAVSIAAESNSRSGGPGSARPPASPLPSGPRRFPLDKKQYLRTPRRQGRRLEIY
jgi:hypothetical protein